MKVKLKKEMRAISGKIMKLIRKANALAKAGSEGGGPKWREAKRLRDQAAFLDDRLKALKSLEFSLGVLIRDAKRMSFKVVAGRPSKIGAVRGKRRKRIMSDISRSMLRNGEYIYEFDNMISLASALKIKLPKGVRMENWKIC